MATCLVLGPISAFVPPSFAQEDALALQGRAVQRIDAFMEHFRKTFDQTSQASELAKAETELITSAETLARRGQEGPAAYSLVKAGDACRMRNQAQRALTYYEQAERLAKKSSTRTNEVLALLGRARTEAYVLKNPRNGQRYFEQAIQLSAGLPDRTHLFNALGGWGNMLAENGDLIGAADAYAREFALANEIKDEKLLFYAYLDRADAYLKMAEKGDYENYVQPCYEQLNLARADYQEALRLAQKLGYAGLARQTQQFIKEVEVRRQMFQAREQSAQAVEKAKLFDPKQPGDVLVTENYTSGATTFPPGFMEFVQRGIMSGGDARSTYVRGLLYTLQDQKKEALAAYLRALELLEVDRRKLRDETGSRAILDDRISFYYEPINLLLEQRRYPEAFNLMERCRSRAMTDLIMGRKLVLPPEGGATLFAQLQQMHSEIAVLQDRLFRQRAEPNGQPKPNALQGTQGEIDRLQEAYRQVVLQLERTAPAASELVAPAVVPLDGLQQMLRELKADMLYYLVREHGLLLWHINGQEVHVRNVFIPRNELESKVQKLRRSVATGDRAGVFDEKIASELFLFAIQPALDWLKSTRLILVPHEALHYVPFQILRNPADGRYLGEGYAISYLANATLLTHLAETGPLNSGRLLAVADSSLEDDSQEVKGLNLKVLYPERHRVLMDAPKTEVKSVVAAYDFVHMSVHGAFDANEPMLSFLQLGKGGDGDRRLTAAEVFGLDLRKAPVVVLSACESGTAIATHGNELMGIQRAFLFAGAKALVVSSWKVDAAATAKWMASFYQAAQANGPAEAARLSLVAVKKEQPHPFYWGGFEFIGK